MNFRYAVLSRRDFPRFERELPRKDCLFPALGAVIAGQLHAYRISSATHRARITAARELCAQLKLDIVGEARRIDLAVFKPLTRIHRIFEEMYPRCSGRVDRIAVERFFFQAALTPQCAHKEQCARKQK